MLRHCDRAQPQRHIVLVGARDLPEVTYLASAQIRRSDVAVLGASDLPDGPLYMHLDLDVADSAEVPGLRHPAPGGPGSAQVAGALHMLLGMGRVAAVGIACTWHPGHFAAARISP
jgi:arginase